MAQHVHLRKVVVLVEKGFVVQHIPCFLLVQRIQQLLHLVSGLVLEEACTAGRLAVWCNRTCSANCTEGSRDLTLQTEQALNIWGSCELCRLQSSWLRQSGTTAGRAHAQIPSADSTAAQSSTSRCMCCVSLTHVSGVVDLLLGGILCLANCCRP